MDTDTTLKKSPLVLVEEEPFLRPVGIVLDPTTAPEWLHFDMSGYVAAGHLARAQATIKYDD